MRFVLPIVITLAAVLLAYAFDVTTKMGAHPFWANQVIFVGTPIGIFCGFLATRLRQMMALVGMGVATILAFFVAHTGKTRFAASYAEDAFAGQMWFFGWNAVVVFAVATLFAAAVRIMRS